MGRVGGRGESEGGVGRGCWDSVCVGERGRGRGGVGEWVEPVVKV